MKNLLLIVLGLSLLAGCANPINGYTAQQYYEYGVQAEKGGDLALAQRNYSRAYGNAQMGNLGPKAEAYYLYEVARVTGYAGMYAESEKEFLDVLTLIEKAKGEADKLRAPALAEYARLLHDTGQHAKAVPIYEKAVAELERVGILTLDPLGFAALLDDYAGSLAAAGFSQRAAEISSRSASIKEAHKGDSPKFEPRRYKV
ncbi:MAG TPA: tetratricopeptide repeat protein [Opitutaceae bacterium]|nr:tetratricopeptide repeat protein [Opitutaceae bacterium]